MDTTTKHAIPYSEGTDAINSIDETSQASAEHLDGIIAVDFQGTLGTRPAAGKSGRYYFASDTGELYRDTGAAWTLVAPRLADVIANRPAAGAAGRRFYSTDTNQEWRDNGTAWVLVGGVLPAVKMTVGNVGNSFATATDTKQPLDNTAPFTPCFDIGHLGTAHFDNANDRFYARVDGRYRLSAAVDWATNATGERVLSVRKNGGASMTVDSRPGSAINWQQAETELLLAAGDYVELWAMQTSGGALQISSGGHFMLEYMGASS